MTYFLLRDYNILPKQELHSSRWVRGNSRNNSLKDAYVYVAFGPQNASGLFGVLARALVYPELPRTGPRVPMEPWARTGFRAQNSIIWTKID